MKCPPTGVSSSEDSGNGKGPALLSQTSRNKAAVRFTSPGDSPCAYCVPGIIQTPDK